MSPRGTVFAWDHRHGLVSRTGDHPVRNVQGEVVFREECPALWPGAGNLALLLRPYSRPSGWVWWLHC